MTSQMFVANTNLCTESYLITILQTAASQLYDVFNLSLVMLVVNISAAVTCL